MKCYKVHSLIVALAVIASSCSNEKKTASGNLMPTESLSSGGGQKIITARSSEEFVRAIGSDREIRMDQQEYILSDLVDRYMDFVRWDPTSAGNTLTIRNVRNLTIVGNNKQPARLIVHPYSVFVLNFEGCTNVIVRNLVMGHAPEKGECECGVVGATSCEKLTFERCDLFGSGTEGLTLDKVSGLLFRDSTIRDCSYGILTAKSCSNLNFERSRFVRNVEFWGLQLHDTRDVLFSDCIIQENKSDDPLFQVVSCSNIRVRGGSISSNKVSSLCNNEKAVVFEKVEGIQPLLSPTLSSDKGSP